MAEACLHLSLVHQHAVEVFERFGSSVCFGEDDSGNAQTAPVLIVRYQNPSDWSNGFGKIFLCAIGS